MVLGIYMVFLLEFSPRGGTVWEKRNPVFMTPGGAPLSYMCNSTYVIGMV